MANHKSTKKRIRSTKTRNEGNKYLHKTVRNALRSAFSDESKEGKNENNKIVSMIDKLEKRNIILSIFIKTPYIRWLYFLFMSKYDGRFFKFKKLASWDTLKRKGAMLNGPRDGGSGRQLPAERHEDFIDEIERVRPGLHPCFLC